MMIVSCRIVLVTQTCNLKFGSWTYDGFMLDISFYDNSSEVDISDYVISNEWELLDQPGVRNVRYYSCCGDHPYPDLTFTLRLRRLSAFYNYTIMLPCVLLSCLTTVIFWLPPESPAKIMLGSCHVYQCCQVHDDLVFGTKWRRSALNRQWGYKEQSFGTVLNSVFKSYCIILIFFVCWSSFSA